MENYISKDEQRQICKKLLDKFVEVCDKHGINYYLYFGSLLGAVRHSDIIPWDDDVDVLVSRSDYMKLLYILKQEFEPYRLVSALTDSDIFHGRMAKLYDNTTVTKDEGVTCTDNPGVFIDIFPYDNRPANIDEDAIRYVKVYKHWGDAKKAKLYFWTWDKNSSIKQNLKWEWEHLGLYLRYFFKSQAWVSQQLDKAMRNYPHTGVFGQSTNVDKGHYLGGRFTMEDLEPYILLKLGDKKYRCPRHYHKILVNHYGRDYMKIPDEDSPLRQIRHPYRYTKIIGNTR